MKGIMIQGTASDVGKSFIVTALCRILANEGVKVTPFKSQNMSNNSYVTKDGKEIGRAQGIQAEAAKIEATEWMNPILLKPCSDQHSEIVYLGKALEMLSGREYREKFYENGLEVVKSSLKQLENEFDMVVIEGAGSPVEINLNDREIVNMTVAELADVPVVLVADIDRGGVFASIVGTIELLEPNERKRVRGLIINKFRGDFTLFEDAIQWLENRTGIPILGVLPYIENHMVDGEDSLSLQSMFSNRNKGAIDIAVIHLPFISNFSDLEPFLYEEDVSIRLVKCEEEFGNPDAVIIPGTKSTISDLKNIRENGLEFCIRKHVENGGFIAGICGGYQILSEEIIDEAGSDTGMPNYKINGIELIPAITTFYREKETNRMVAHYHENTSLPTNHLLEGYEIHLGKTVLTKQGCSFLLFNNDEEDGYFGNNGQIIGTYLHHLFHNDEWRNQWLNMIRKQKGLPIKEAINIRKYKDERFEKLALQVKKYLKLDLLKDIINQW
ncbi:cobyric acid synthase [Neobacillus massiliamazoniensis]|uniref:Cobyric acid synthase n=1 Tax=Neobacillus massiliamazoniensis TaxID=1499688 RepID=A0A0U1NTB8_9BACI|nr:cobyric acid synthase [Neobacillus massiliamazoniensis]CRK80978.1 cobyric acid synthase [Neobacillus massiliamazoniensis]